MAGIFGGGLSIPLAARFGLLKPFVVSTAVHALAVTAAVQSPNLFLLGVPVFSEGVTFIILTPLMLALAAEIDREGLWAAAAGGLFALTAGFGPIVGGWFAENVGFHSLGWLNLIAAVPTIAIFYWVGGKVIRQQA